MLAEFLPSTVATTAAPAQGREYPTYPRRDRARAIKSTRMTISMSAGLFSTISMISRSSDRFSIPFSSMSGMETRGGASNTVAPPAGLAMRSGSRDSRERSSGGSPVSDLPPHFSDFRDPAQEEPVPPEAGDTRTRPRALTRAISNAATTPKAPSNQPPSGWLSL